MKRELDEVLGADLGVGADVEQRHRVRRAPAAGARARGGRCRRAPDVEEPGGERGAGRAAGHERVGVGRRRRRGRRGRSRRPAPRATRRRGRPPWRSRPARRRSRRPRRRLAELVGGAEEEDADVLRRRRSPRRRRPRPGPRSAPLASTATVTRHGATRLLVVVVVLGGDDLAARVVPARPGRRGAAGAGCGTAGTRCTSAPRSCACARRLVVRLCDCFCFGTAMGDAQGSRSRPGGDRRGLSRR